MKNKLSNNFIFSWIFFVLLWPCTIAGEPKHVIYLISPEQDNPLLASPLHFIAEWSGEANNASGSLTTTETLCLDKDFNKLYICVTPLTSTQDPVGFVLYLHLCGADTASECSEWQIFVSIAAASQKALYEMQFSLPTPWRLVKLSLRQCSGNIFLVRSLVRSFPVNFPLSIIQSNKWPFLKPILHTMCSHISKRGIYIYLWYPYIRI